MAQPDAALGIAATFPQAQFEAAVRFAMQMGTPNEESRRVAFVFPGEGKTYWKNGQQLDAPPRLDLSGKPIDPGIEVREGEETRVLVDCAFELSDSPPAREDAVGTFQRTKLEVTLLEAEYQQIKGCSAAIYNEDRFIYSHEPEAYGLFGSDVHTIVFVSEDDT